MKFFEKVMRGIIYKIMPLSLADKICEKVIQFVKFGLVGVSNTLVSYVIYVLFLILFQRVGLFPNKDYLIAQFIGYVLSIFWAFYWNQKCVFNADESKVVWYIALAKSFIAYSFTGVFLNSFLSYIWVEIVGISKLVVPIVNLFINVPANFLLNKLWIFHDNNITK